MKPSIFDNLDVQVVAYAAFMGTLISVLMTTRERNRQRASGLPLSPWITVIPDTLIGTLTGLALALTLPMQWPALNSVTGIAFLAGVGGVLGPKLWDLIGSDGLRIGLKALAASLAGPLGNLAKAAEQASQGKETMPPPVAPSPAPPTPTQEVGENDGETTSTPPTGELVDESRPH